jgi:hypothetical protein
MRLIQVGFVNSLSVHLNENNRAGRRERAQHKEARDNDAHNRANKNLICRCENFPHYDFLSEPKIMKNTISSKKRVPSLADE